MEDERHRQESLVVHGVNRPVETLEEEGVDCYPLSPAKGSPAITICLQATKVRRGEDHGAEVLAGTVRQIRVPLARLRQVGTIPARVSHKEERRTVRVREIPPGRGNLDLSVTVEWILALEFRHAEAAGLPIQPGVG